MLNAWYKEAKNSNDVVISSRIRLARNLYEFPFSIKLGKEQSEEVVEKIKNAFFSSTTFDNDYTFYSQDDLLIKGGILLERHLISREMLENKLPCGAIVSNDENVSLLLNEEDHLRIQVLKSGFSLDDAFNEADKIDTILEGKLDFAFSEQFGYLTSCPSNAGTGMRASVMLHLPGFVKSRNISNVINAVSKIGITVRGLYGEGTDSTGDIFQISNQITLGLSEKETIQKLTSVAEQIISEERGLRAVINNAELEDTIYRSLGILKYARQISFKEFLKLYSNVRLGVSLNVLNEFSLEALNNLMVTTGPYHIMENQVESLTHEQRDTLRSKTIRKILS